MKRYFRMAGLCILMILGCSACGQAQIENIQSIDTAMGTVVRQSVYLTDTAFAESEEAQSQATSSVLSDITQILQNLEEQVLSWRMETSQVAAINASAGNPQGIALSGEMADILLACNQVAEDSNGALDITIGEVVRLWDIDAWASYENSTVQDTSTYVLPQESEIAEALAKSGYEKLVWNKQGEQETGDSAYVLTLPDEVQIDLGAVGKGIALDSIHAYLQECPQVCGAVISVGGSVLTYGSKNGDGAESNPWKVGIVNPLNTEENIGYLTLEGQWCVSTSGDYERYVEVDGKRYHHIIDPSTGMPADSGVRSVTILTKDGLESDALSTACFILGVEEGMELAEKYGAQALFIDANGEITMSEGMEQYFHLY